MSILEKLYMGDIQPTDGRLINSRYKKAESAKLRCYNHLHQQLKGENLSWLDKLCENTAEMEYEYGEEMFKLGFSIALQLSAESFLHKI